jgi:hypothetical protein
MALGYTDEMRKAFHAIPAPKGFGVDLIDNTYFITIRIDEKAFLYLSHDQKMEAFEYVIKVQKALEASGAVVQVVRKPLK